jgi:CO/xanthine dehydrogenase Mo-binding subunit
MVGRSTQRVDAVEKVTGRARFTSDLSMPGMAHAVVVRSTVGHGELGRIDATAALAMPGVLAVLTGEDVEALGAVDPYYGLTILDQRILPTDKVRFVGDPVAVVVAETLATAQAASRAVDVDLEPLPEVTTIEDALASSIAIHDRREGPDPARPNLCATASFENGDVDGAIAGAAYVHEATYRFPVVSHYAMEPHACLARWGTDHDEHLEVWTSTQQPFKIRGDLGRIFDLPLNGIRVRAPYVGGAYGGKGQSKYEPLCAVAARAVGRPVRLVLSAEESFHTIARHGAEVRMRTAVDGDGNLIARDTEFFMDTGAFADKGPGVLRKAAYRAAGPYGFPNFRSTGHLVYTNKVPAGAFRGYSTPQVVWAGESAIDEIAEHLGEDPLEFRRRRLARRGEDFFPGDTPLDADLVQGIALAAEQVGWGEGGEGHGHGRGVAVGAKDGGGGATRAEAEVRLHQDGSVDVRTGTSEIGQGALTIYRQLAAEELGVGYDDVRTHLPDTDAAPFDHGTNASRSAVMVGSAVVDAARQVRDELCAAVQRVLGVALEGAGADRARLDGRDVLVDGTRHPLVELLSRDREVAPIEVGPIVGRGIYRTRRGEGPLGAPSLFYEVGHSAAEVDVDLRTGEVHLRRLASVADVGFALNPSTCEGQDEGAAVMALGHTFHEELVFEDAQPISTNLTEYHVPLVRDLPSHGLHTVLLQNQDGPGPRGAKGAGEGGIIGVGPAVANAVRRATGARIRQLPLTPERVYRALQAQDDRTTHDGPNGTHDDG